MADIREIMQRGATGQTTQFQQVPTPSVIPQSSAEAIGGALMGVGQTAFTSYRAAKKEQAKELQATNLGGLANRIADIDQAATTNPNIDKETEYRKAYRKWASKNPSQAKEGLDLVKGATGESPLGYTREEQVRIELFEEAQKAHLVDMDAPQDVQEQQFEDYLDLKQKSETAAKNIQILNEKKLSGQIEEETLKKEIYKTTPGLVESRYNALSKGMDADLAALRTGKISLEDLQTKWRTQEIEFGIEVSKLGQFANDPTIKAQISPITDLFQLRKDIASGKIATEAAEAKAKEIQAKADLIVLGDPEVAISASFSKIYGHTPIVGMDMTANYQKIMKDGPINLQGTSRGHANNLNKTLNSMSDDPDALGEAVDKVDRIVTHAVRNGDDYSAEDINTVITTINNTKVFAQFTPEQKEKTVRFVENYAVNEAAPVIYNMQSRATVQTPITFGTYGEVTGGGENIPFESFARFEVTENGINVLPQPAFEGDRATRMRIESMRRELSEKVNPTFQVYVKNADISPEEAAIRLFGINTQEERTPLPQGQDTPETTTDYETGLEGMLPQPTQAGGQTTPAAERDVLENIPGMGYGVRPTDTIGALSPEAMQGQAERRRDLFETPSVGVYQGNEQARQERVAMPVASRWADLADSLQQQGFGDAASALRMEARRKAYPAGQEDAMTGATYKAEEKWIDNVLEVEGEGDDLSDVVTGKAGVTKPALEAIDYPEKDPTKITYDQSRDVVRQYAAHLDKKFKTDLPGYSELSQKARFAILNNAYNLGPGIAKYPKFKAAVEAGDEVEAMKQLLDTATEGGKAVRGLAKRRAEAYNEVADVPIATVEQKKDGTLIYWDRDGIEVFRYKPAGGRHSGSAVGKLAVY